MVKEIKPPLTDQQREALMRLLHGMGLPLEEIARMGAVVAGETTYGTIAFEHWKAARKELRSLEPTSIHYADRGYYCADCNANHAWDVVCPKKERP
jgi:hypothetical protein